MLINFHFALHGINKTILTSFLVFAGGKINGMLCEVSRDDWMCDVETKFN